MLNFFKATSSHFFVQSIGIRLAVSRDNDEPAYLRNMIQRVQSLYLLIIFLISCLMFFGNPGFAIFKDTVADKKVKLGYMSTTTYALSRPADAGIAVIKPLNILLIAAIGLSALAAIFLFKNTKLQKQICMYITIMAAVITVILFIDFSNISKQLPGGNTYPGLHTVWPIACAVLGVLAWSAIRRDEQLISSMDRIR